MIDFVNRGLTIQMANINELNLVTVTPASLVNGATTTYTITVNVETPLYDGDKFTITFPGDINLPSSPICVASTSLTAVSCAPKVGQRMTATLTFSGGQIASRTDFAFQVQSCVNPPDTYPTSTFLNIFALDSSDSNISQYSTPVTV